jgi:hypothetical protein
MHLTCTGTGANHCSISLITISRKWRIPRWWLEGGSRKQASYSEILERCWRHTLQAKSLKRGKTLTPPHLQPAQRSLLHIKQRNNEGPWAASRLCPNGLGRRGQGELHGTTVLPQTRLGQSSIAPGQTDPHPGKKEKLSNKQ